MDQLTDIKVTGRQLTDFSLVNEIIEFTTGIDVSKYDKLTAFRNEHSLIRTQLYLFLCTVPSFVSTHFVRHSQTGQFHMVTSNREDLQQPASSKEEPGRWTPVNHVMILNGKHLIDMARYRECDKAHNESRALMQAIHREVTRIEPDLSLFMVPNCFYRGGLCPENKPCGMFSGVDSSDYRDQFPRRN